MLIKTISKISVFSLLGAIMNGWLASLFLSLWLHPQSNDVEMINNLTILVVFEFVLVHSGVFMSILGRSWKGWAGFIVFYGIFALAFNAMVNDNQILIIYGVVVLNRMLPVILSSKKTGKAQGLLMSFIYATIYLVLLFSVVFGSSYIPQFGLTEAFLESADFSSINLEGGGFFEVPHIIMCFGVLYYLILMFVGINTEIQSVKAALLPSVDNGQTLNEEPEIENKQAQPTIIHQFEKGDNKLPSGCGCTPWLVFVLAIALTAIGLYQSLVSETEIGQGGGELFIWIGTIMIPVWAGLLLIGKIINKKRQNPN